MKPSKKNIFTLGNGVPVILLHSAMSSKLQWYKLMFSMSKEYKMIAVDMYGYGDSPFPTNPDTFCLRDEISLVESLVEDLIPKNESFHLVGHSYGAAVSLRWAYEAPERVRSLSLYEPVSYHLLPENEEALAKTRMEQTVVDSYVKEGKFALGAEQFIDAWNGPGAFSRFPKEIQDLLLVGVKKLPLGFRALMDEPLSLEDYRNIKIPVCLMAGKQSPLSSRRIAELLADYLSNCRFHWIESGHMAPVNRPDSVNPIIESFIRSIR